MTQPETHPSSAAPKPERLGRSDSFYDKLRQVIRKLGRELDHPEWGSIPPGDVSALRRSRPGDIGGPAFWKIAVREIEPAGLLPPATAPWRDDAERRWTTILAGMAEMAGLHSGGLSLGRALAGPSGSERLVSEARVLRLLQAHGESLLRLVRPVAHQLASRGARLDWTDLAHLVLSDGKESQDHVRRRIALDYYASLSR